MNTNYSINQEELPLNTSIEQTEGQERSEIATTLQLEDQTQNDLAVEQANQQSLLKVKQAKEEERVRSVIEQFLEEGRQSLEEDYSQEEEEEEEEDVQESDERRESRVRDRAEGQGHDEIIQEDSCSDDYELPRVNKTRKRRQRDGESSFHSEEILSSQPSQFKPQTAGNSRQQPKPSRKVSEIYDKKGELKQGADSKFNTVETQKVSKRNSIGNSGMIKKSLFGGHPKRQQSDQNTLQQVMLPNIAHRDRDRGHTTFYNSNNHSKVKQRNQDSALNYTQEIITGQGSLSRMANEETIEQQIKNDDIKHQLPTSPTPGKKSKLTTRLGSKASNRSKRGGDASARGPSVNSGREKGMKKKERLTRINQLTKLEIIIRILQKSFRSRSERDLENLVPLIKTIQFFQERDIKDQDYREIVSCLTYEHFHAGDTVFEYGESGEKFYIILQGGVRVLIPDYQGNKEVLHDIEAIRKEIESHQRELKDVNAALDYEKKLMEEYMRQLKEEEERLMQNEFSDSNSLSSRQALERKLTRRVSQRKSNNNFNSPNTRGGGENQITETMNSMSYASEEGSLKRSKEGLNRQGTIGRTIGRPSIKNQQTKRLSENKIMTSTDLQNTIKDSIAKGVLEMAKKNGLNLFKFAAPAIKQSQVLTNLMPSVFEEESEALSKLEKEKKKKQPIIQKKTLQSKDLTLEERKQLLLQQIKELKHKEEQTLFIEVVQLHTGKSFGELALIKNKPRAATIKCAEECHFGVMSKADYDKVLLRIEQKNLNKLLDFLNQLPFLQNWSKVQLQKLQYALELKSLKRNTVLYREGEPCQHVYIIKSGDFEVAKRVKVNDGTQQMIESMHNMLGPHQMPVIDAHEVKGFTSAVKQRQQDFMNRSPITNANSQLQPLKEFMHQRKISETADKKSKSLLQQHQLKLGKQLPSYNRNAQDLHMPLAEDTNAQKKKKKAILNDDKLQQLGSSKIMAANGGQMVFNTYKIAQIGTGQMLGEEDVIKSSAYTTTVTCKSNMGEVFCMKTTEFQKRMKNNPDSWKIIILMAMGKENAIFHRIKQIKQLLANNQSVNDFGGFGGGFGFSLLKDNILINQKEVDVREKFKEIINDYPSIDCQKKIIEKQLHSPTQIGSRKLMRDLSVKRTVDVNLGNLTSTNQQRKASQLPNIIADKSLVQDNSSLQQCSHQLKQRSSSPIQKSLLINSEAQKNSLSRQNLMQGNQSRSQSPLGEGKNQKSGRPSKVSYISSRIASLIEASIEGKNISEEMKSILLKQRDKKHHSGLKSNSLNTTHSHAFNQLGSNFKSHQLSLFKEQKKQQLQLSGGLQSESFHNKTSEKGLMKIQINQNSNESLDAPQQSILDYQRTTGLIFQPKVNSSIKFQETDLENNLNIAAKNERSRSVSKVSKQGSHSKNPEHDELVGKINSRLESSQSNPQVRLVQSIEHDQTIDKNSLNQENQQNYPGIVQGTQYNQQKMNVSFNNDQKQGNTLNQRQRYYLDQVGMMKMNSPLSLEQQKSYLSTQHNFTSHMQLQQHQSPFTTSPGEGSNTQPHMVPTFQANISQRVSNNHSLSIDRNRNNLTNKQQAIAHGPPLSLLSQHDKSQFFSNSKLQFGSFTQKPVSHMPVAHTFNKQSGKFTSKADLKIKKAGSKSPLGNYRNSFNLQHQAAANQPPRLAKIGLLNSSIDSSISTNNYINNHDVRVKIPSMIQTSDYAGPYFPMSQQVTSKNQHQMLGNSLLFSANLSGSNELLESTHAASTQTGSKAQFLNKSQLISTSLPHRSHHYQLKQPSQQVLINLQQRMKNQL